MLPTDDLRQDPPCDWSIKHQTDHCRLSVCQQATAIPPLGQEQYKQISVSIRTARDYKHLDVTLPFCIRVQEAHSPMQQGLRVPAPDPATVPAAAGPAERGEDTKEDWIYTNG